MLGIRLGAFEVVGCNDGSGVGSELGADEKVGIDDGNLVGIGDIDGRKLGLEDIVGVSLIDAASVAFVASAAWPALLA